MASPSTMKLSSETLSSLQNLIQVNIDSYNGFNEAAKQIEDVTIASLFEQLATQRMAQANSLKALVAANGEQPQESGSTAAALHRVWLDIRSKISSGDAYSVLAEAERGEDHIKQMYEEAIKSNAGTGASSILHEQYASVKAAHDRVRDLRDARKES